MVRSFCVGVLVGVFLVFSSCEKVVDIPLNDAEPQIVVEAVAKSLVGESYVLLSKTIGAYDASSEIPQLSGAIVEISDAFGNEFVFSEDPLVNGRYSNADFAVLPNMNYDLSVNFEGELLEATAQSLTMPRIDSLSVYQDIGGLGGDPSDVRNVLVYTVSDNPDEKNFYRFVLWVNGVKNNTLFIETDDLGNGLTYTSPFFGVRFDAGDSVYAELWSMSAKNYDYFSALYTNLNQSPVSAAPGDLPSNIENGIGYFGTFMVDTMSIVIP